MNDHTDNDDLPSFTVPLSRPLGALEWDGGRRLDNWMTNYLGAEMSPRTSIIGRRWMIAAVARALQPGCDVPWVLLIEATPGAEAWTLEGLRALATTFGRDTEPLGFDARDDREGRAARWWAWITVQMEIPQRGVALGNALSRATASVDRVRKAFTTEVKDIPRDWLSIMVSNDVSPEMRDSRRLQIVQVPLLEVEKARAMLAALMADRRQLLAEAVVAFRAGESWQVPS